jgi:hypothetical protein
MMVISGKMLLPLAEVAPKMLSLIAENGTQCVLCDNSVATLFSPPPKSTNVPRGTLCHYARFLRGINGFNGTPFPIMNRARRQVPGPKALSFSEAVNPSARMFHVEHFSPEPSSLRRVFHVEHSLRCRPRLRRTFQRNSHGACRNPLMMNVPSGTSRCPDRGAQMGCVFRVERCYGSSRESVEMTSEIFPNWF